MALQLKPNIHPDEPSVRWTVPIPENGLEFGCAQYGVPSNDLLLQFESKLLAHSSCQMLTEGAVQKMNAGQADKCHLQVCLNAHAMHS